MRRSPQLAAAAGLCLAPLSAALQFGAEFIDFSTEVSNHLVEFLDLSPLLPSPLFLVSAGSTAVSLQLLGLAGQVLRLLMESCTLKLFGCFPKCVNATFDGFGLRKRGMICAAIVSPVVVARLHSLPHLAHEVAGLLMPTHLQKFPDSSLHALRILRVDSLGFVTTLRVDALGLVSTLRVDSLGLVCTLRVDSLGLVCTLRVDSLGLVCTLRVDSLVLVCTLRVDSLGLVCTLRVNPLGFVSTLGLVSLGLVCTLRDLAVLLLLVHAVRSIWSGIAFAVRTPGVGAVIALSRGLAGEPTLVFFVRRVSRKGENR